LIPDAPTVPLEGSPGPPYSVAPTRRPCPAGPSAIDGVVDPDPHPWWGAGTAIKAIAAISPTPAPRTAAKTPTAATAARRDDAPDPLPAMARR